MVATGWPPATRFDTHQLDGGVFDKGIEHASGVTATTHAGDDGIGESAQKFEALLTGFATDDRLKIADYAREGVWPHDASKNVVGVLDGSHPVAHGLVDGISQSSASSGNWLNNGAHGPHFKNIQFLTADIFLPHENRAWEAQEGTCGGTGDTVLARSSFGNDAGFSHAFGQKGLAKGVVYFVGPCVVQVFALEVDFCPAGQFRKPLGEMEGSGATNKVLEVVIEGFMELGIFNRILVGSL